MVYRPAGIAPCWKHTCLPGSVLTSSLTMPGSKPINSWDKHLLTWSNQLLDISLDTDLKSHCLPSSVNQILYSECGLSCENGIAENNLWSMLQVYSPSNFSSQDEALSCYDDINSTIRLI